MFSFNGLLASIPNAFGEKSVSPDHEVSVVKGFAICWSNVGGTANEKFIAVKPMRVSVIRNFLNIRVDGKIKMNYESTEERSAMKSLMMMANPVSIAIPIAIFLILPMTFFVSSPLTAHVTSNTPL